MIVWLVVGVVGWTAADVGVLVLIGRRARGREFRVVRLAVLDDLAVSA